MGSFSTFETKVVLRPPTRLRGGAGAFSFLIFADTFGPNQTRPGLAIKANVQSFPTSRMDSSTVRYFPAAAIWRPEVRSAGAESDGWPEPMPMS